MSSQGIALMAHLLCRAGLGATVKDSFFLAVEYDVSPEEGAVNLQIAPGRYETALEELRPTGEVQGWL